MRILKNYIFESMLYNNYYILKIIKNLYCSRIIKIFNFYLKRGYDDMTQD